MLACQANDFAWTAVVGSPTYHSMKILHLDMDSFFATVEQQARPTLRGRPVGISLAPSPGGTIVAASREAKRLGVGTGTRVAEARRLIPDITLLKPSPAKYRVVHRRFRRIVADYAAIVKPRSIDEVALWLEDRQPDKRPAAEIGAEIKQRIKDEVGDWLSSSVGIGPNWLLAKTASNLEKPDGLVEITRENTRQVLGRMELRDLCGIAKRMEARFQLLGIRSPVELYDLPPWELKRRLGIAGYYWHLRLHGYPIDETDWPTRSIGHSSVIPRPSNDLARLQPLLHKLCERSGRRIREGGWLATVVSVSGGEFWGSGWQVQTRVAPLADSRALFTHARRLLAAQRFGPLRKLGVSVRGLQPADPEQPSLFTEGAGGRQVVAALDAVNDRWGELTVHPAGMLGTKEAANDSIAFGQDMRLQREQATDGGWSAG